LITLPVARQISVSLAKYESESFQLETQAVDTLLDRDCPPSFYIHWRFNRKRQSLIRILNGADGYLGSGWFFSDRYVWQIPGTYSAEMRRWIGRAEIPSHDLFAFVSQASALNRRHFRCDLTVEPNFTVSAHLIKLLKNSIDVQLTSNKLELQPEIVLIQGDNANLMSGTTLLPGWKPILGDVLLHLARSGQPVRVSGDDLPALLRDGLLAHADVLHIDP